ncbi:MAG: hypothetical protein HKO03_00605 [Acidimicrobiia bacterium]|nr:hypothetical protein [Acidimicrobiia bacterium]
MFVMVDGEIVENGEVPLPYTDQGLQRGDGCFEFVRLYDGAFFALDEHLDRLTKSADMLGLELPDRDTITGWFHIASKNAAPHDCGVRLLVTRREPDTKRVRCVLGVDELPAPRLWRMTVVNAPWQPAGATWELAGAKTLSYAPNMAAARLAQDRGYDDAVLISRSGVVLEAPRAALAWAIGGVLETPALTLGILDSITRRHVLLAASEIGIEVVEGQFHLDRMLAADEVLGLSSAKEVASIVAIDDNTYPEGPVTERLAKAFTDRVSSLIGL